MAEEEKYLKRMIELKGENGTNLMRFPWGNDWYAIIRTPDLKHKLYIFNEDFPNGKHIITNLDCDKCLERIPHYYI